MVICTGYNSHNQKAKKIVFVFLVITLVSSLTTVSFLTNNMNLAFASQKDGSSGSGNESTTDNTGGGTTTAGSNNSNSGGSSSDTGSTNARTLVNPGPSNIVSNSTSPRSDENCPSMTPIFYQGKC